MLGYVVLWMGFSQAFANLVNAFKTKNGLPMFDDYNEEIAYPVNGQMNGQKWDPRLFHTVGMPTYPYKYEAEYMMTKIIHAHRIHMVIILP